MIPLSVPHLKGNEQKYVAECLESNWISSAGEFVNRFEQEMAAFVGSSFAVACTSGSSALHISLLLAGVRPDDEVLVPTVTFIAPVNAIRYVGASPVFMDCDDTLNMDAEKVAHFLNEECERRDDNLYNKVSGRRIRAILPVHIFGHPVTIAPLMDLASRFQLELIEDASESLGSAYTRGPFEGKKTGSIGSIGCFSFNGNKIISTGGGGMIVCDDEKLAERARYLTTQAKDDSFEFVHNEIGYNYRLTNVHAAIGVAQLEQVSDFIAIKRNNFNKYREALNDCNGLRFILEPEGTSSNYWYYSLLVNNGHSVALCHKLNDEGIQARPLWRLNHLQKPYLLDQQYRLEKSIDYSTRVVNIPCSVGISDQEIQKTVDVIRSVV
jgi:perosamine synthetase